MSADADSGHDYDGIREYDNPLPGWWLTALYATIVFGFGYWMFFQVFGGTSLAAQLQKDEAAAAARAAATAPVTDELLLALAKDGGTQATARALFVQQCAQSHLADGSGKIGPNLTDEYWLHGDKPSQIYQTIATGVLVKGMPAWGPLLGQEKVKQLASYIVTLKHGHRPGKPPEGQKVESVSD
jgi:cytochrome c oxidase cbb3-type subunit 3